MKKSSRKQPARYENCAGCGWRMRNPVTKYCRDCCLKTEKFDIKVSSDYNLKVDDLSRGLIFLHACGNDVLQSFLDKCFTGVDAFIEEMGREPFAHVNDVDPNVLDFYEEHELHWYETSVLKSPQSAVARHRQERIKRKLDNND